MLRQTPGARGFLHILAKILARVDASSPRIKNLSIAIKAERGRHLHLVRAGVVADAMKIRIPARPVAGTVAALRGAGGIRLSLQPDDLGRAIGELARRPSLVLFNRLPAAF